jgi:hypothetical protein
MLENFGVKLVMVSRDCGLQLGLGLYVSVVITNSSVSTMRVSAHYRVHSNDMAVNC